MHAIVKTHSQRELQGQDVPACIVIYSEATVAFL